MDGLRLSLVWFTNSSPRGLVARMVEQRPFKALVPGSSPGQPIFTMV